MKTKTALKQELQPERPEARFSLRPSGQETKSGEAASVGKGPGRIVVT